MRSQNGAMKREGPGIFLLAFAISAAAVTAAGCGGDTLQAPSNESDARASIVNDSYNNAGMAEMMRADSQSRVPTAMLSRAMVGIRGNDPP